MKKSLLIKLSKMILNLSETETNNGVLVYDGELVEGVEVFVIDENGEYVPAADGEYETETLIITVLEGKVSSIVEKVIEAEEQPVEEPVEEVIDETEELKAKISELEATIEELKKEIEEKDLKIADLEGQIKKQDEIAEEELSKQTPAYKETKEIEAKSLSLADAVRNFYKNN